MERPFFSITIPTYGYNGRGVEFINHNLHLIEKQTFKDFEIIISDHSVDDTIKKVIDDFIITSKCKVTYLKCEHGRGYISPNLNNALKNSNGKYIKILFQDDFLFNEYALENQFNVLSENPNIKWLITEFEHSNDGFTFYRHYHPSFQKNIWSGNNTLGNPSNLTILNEDLIFFDETLNWLMDCEYYYRLYLKHGYPCILNEITVVNRTHGGGLTDNTSNELKQQELEKLTSLYA